MNTKNILADTRQNTKKNFWIYLAVIVITGSVSGLFSGDFDFFAVINKCMGMIRSGLFSRSQLLSPDSEFYTVLQSVGTFSGGMGILGIAASIFICNPLSVGENKFFYNGIYSSPDIKTLIEPFKNNYLNTVSVMFMRELILSVILFGISLIYMIVLSFGIGVSVVFENFFSPSYAIIGFIFTALITIAASVGYIVWSLSVSYNFIFIGYILAENPSCGFNTAYRINKEIVRGKKFDIFKADFHYVKWMIVAFLVPFAFIACGIVNIILNNNGLTYLIIGLFMIIPVVFIFLLIDVFRKALNAHIYSSIKKPNEDFEIFTPNDFDNKNSYELPSNHEPISYSDDSTPDSDN